MILRSNAYMLDIYINDANVLKGELSRPALAVLKPKLCVEKAFAEFNNEASHTLKRIDRHTEIPTEIVL